MEALRVLMTGTGAPGAPSIIKCLRKNGERDIQIVGVDMNAKASARSLVDVFYTVPAGRDPHFIDAILDICIRERIQIVLPLVTRELEVFSKNRPRFEECGIRVSVMDEKKLHVANNKGLLLSAMRDAGLAVPNFVIANSADGVFAGIDEIGYPDCAVVVKPTFGNGSRGTRIIDPFLSRYDRFFNEKPDSNYISVEELFAILHERDSIPEMMIMEYLPGTEYSVDVLAHQGETLACVCRRGVKVVNSIMTESVIEKNPRVENLCKQVVQLLKLDGNIGFDLKERENGEPLIMEINPRLTAGVVACAIAGVNFPYLRMKQLLGEELPVVSCQIGSMMQRRYQEIFFSDRGEEIHW